MRDSVRRSIPHPVALLALVAVAALVPLLSACSRGPKDSEKVLAALQEKKAEVDRRTDDLVRRLDEYNKTRAPGQREIRFTELFAPDLTPEQQRVLDDLLRGEQDATYKGLLEQIRKDREEIQGLQLKIADLEAKLPGNFVTVKKGDTHYELALKYLSAERGLAEAEARKALADVGLFEDIAPGNHVYIFYDKDTRRFGTYVTQGEAKSSPLAVQRAIRRRLITERDAAIAKSEDLETKMVALKQQIDGLQDEVRGLEERRAKLQEDLETTVHSLYYHIASEIQLMEEKVVKDGIFTTPQLDDPERVAYDHSLDLRQATMLALRPENFGLKKIRHVILFPKFYAEGRDYKVTEGRDGSVAIELLKPALFEGKHVLFALKD